MESDKKKGKKKGKLKNPQEKKTKGQTRHKHREREKIENNRVVIIKFHMLLPRTPKEATPVRIFYAKVERKET